MKTTRDIRPPPRPSMGGRHERSPSSTLTCWTGPTTAGRRGLRPKLIVRVKSTGQEYALTNIGMRTLEVRLLAWPQRHKPHNNLKFYRYVT